MAARIVWTFRAFSIRVARSSCRGTISPRRRRTTFWLFVILWGLPLYASTDPFTVEDMLKLEGFGSATADPQGRWFVYERIRPYEDNEDFSFRTYAFGGKSGHQLWRYDLMAGGEPEPLPGLDPRPHSYQLGFSPTGRFL